MKPPISVKKMIEKINPALNSINVTATKNVLPSGDITQIIATTSDQYGNRMAGINISWTVSNSTVGSVNPLNAITGADGKATTTFISRSVGNAMINATNGSVKGSASVTVNQVVPPPPVPQTVFLGLTQKGGWNSHIYNNINFADPDWNNPHANSKVTNIKNDSGYNLSLAHGGPGSLFIVINDKSSTSAFNGVLIKGDWTAQVGGSTVSLPLYITIKVDWIK